MKFRTRNIIYNDQLNIIMINLELTTIWCFFQIILYIFVKYFLYYISMKMLTLYRLQSGASSELFLYICKNIIQSYYMIHITLQLRVL